MATATPDSSCYITARRAFHESETFATLTIFAKGVPDESYVQLKLDGAGQQLEALVTVPGRGVCSFTATLTAAVEEPVAILISPSKLKVELKMQKRSAGLWGSLGRLAMHEATEPAPGCTEPAPCVAGATAPPHCIVRFPLVGLQNTGNTCFMNSVLQCVSAVEELQLYFRTGRFRRDVNKENALGMQGRLAHGYADLLDQMLRQSASSDTRGRPGSQLSQVGTVAPRELKSLMALYQRRFAGTSQHDASEFLTFLLDGLHEDLNRVRKKPEYQELDSDDDEVEDASVKITKFWDWWTSRTASAISDLFQGVMQVERRCVECGRVRKSFDACWNIQCELPRAPCTVGIGVIVTFADPHRRPLAVGIVTSPAVCWESVAGKIASLAGVREDSLLIAEMVNSEIRVLMTPRAAGQSGSTKSATATATLRHDTVILAYEMSQLQLQGSTSDTGPVVCMHLPPTRREWLDSQIEVSAADTADPCRLKALGNDLFTSGKVELAVEAYSRAIAVLQTPAHAGMDTVLATCLLNRSSCNLKLGQLEDVLSDTTTALRILADVPDEDAAADLSKMRMKSHYRRGQALAMMKCSDAKAELLCAAKLAPADKQIRKAYEAAKKSAKAWTPYIPPYVHPHFVFIPAANSTDSKQLGRELYTRVWETISAQDCHNTPESGIAISIRSDTDSHFASCVLNTVGNVDNRCIRDSAAPVPCICSNSKLIVSWSAEAWNKCHGADVAPHLVPTCVPTLASFQRLPAFTNAAQASASVSKNVDLRQWRPVQDRGSVEEALQCRSKVTSIYDCIRLHMAQEHMTGDDQAYCNRCKHHCDSVREQKLAIAPKILALTLKRFSHDGHNANMMQRMFGGNKVNVPIALPATLDLSEFMAKGSIRPRPYELIACVNHFGMVIGGHYTACARHGEVWYGFDDDDVSTLGEEMISPPTGNSASYMLLFRQDIHHEYDGLVPRQRLSQNEL